MEGEKRNTKKKVQKALLGKRKEKNSNLTGCTRMKD